MCYKPGGLLINFVMTLMDQEVMTAAELTLNRQEEVLTEKHMLAAYYLAGKTALL